MMNDSYLLQHANRVLAVCSLMFLLSIYSAYQLLELPIELSIASHISVIIAATGVKLSYVLRLAMQHRLGLVLR